MREAILHQPLMILGTCLIAGTISAPLAAHQLEGRMTGGGAIQCPDVGRVTHGFELYCDRNSGGIPGPNNLEINWGIGNRFHLTELQTVDCKDDPNIDSAPPGGNAHAGFDTMVGTGTGVGRYNSVPEQFTIKFKLTDAGEPGAGIDEAYFEISRIGTNEVVLYCPLTTLEQGGNHQAHRATGNKF